LHLTPLGLRRKRNVNSAARFVPTIKEAESRCALRAPRLSCLSSDDREKRGVKNNLPLVGKADNSSRDKILLDPTAQGTLAAGRSPGNVKETLPGDHPQPAPLHL
jgi:hypothetical protein